MQSFTARSHSGGELLLNSCHSVLPSCVCVSVRVYQHGFHLTDFSEICYWGLESLSRSSKFVEQLQIRLWGYLTRYCYIVDRDVPQQCTHKTLLRFHCRNGYVNAPQCCVEHALPVLLVLNLAVRVVTTVLERVNSPII
jgi:hypothetical protein